MARTFLRPDLQIRNTLTYDDTLSAGGTLETQSTIEGDFNALRSQVKRVLGDTNWYNDLNTPSALDAGSQRGVNDLNTDLHAVERKRVLVSADKYAVDIAVGSGNNFVILGAGELPNNTTAAVGAVTTAGTVAAAHGGTFGTHSLAEVSGGSAISPKSLCQIVAADSHDPILSSGRKVYALLQTESSSDGHTITTSTPTRAQLSFVRLNAGGDDLEAVPVADIENLSIHYAVAERKALEDLNEQDFLRGAVTDVPSSAVVTQQVAYDNQGATAVDLTTNFTLDLEGAGLVWKIRDDTQADLFSVTEGSGGGTTTIELGDDVDTFSVRAAQSGFLNGASFDTAGTPIEIAESPGVVGRAGDLTLRASGSGELIFDDSYRSGSSWSLLGVNLADSSAEWSAFETAFGEVSLLNAIVAAKTATSRAKYVAVATADVAADANVTGAGGGANLSAQLGDYSGVTFVDDVDIFVNGQLMRCGADASANYDVYPGTSAANGDLKFEFALVGTGATPDVITMIIHGA